MLQVEYPDMCEAITYRPNNIDATTISEIQPFERLALAVVTRGVGKDKEVLFVEKNERYGLPGGHVEPGETSEKAIIREIVEELQLVVEPEDLTLVHTVELHNNKVPGIADIFQITVFAGTAVNAEPDVHTSIGWHSLTSVEEKVSPHIKMILGDIQNGITHSVFYPSKPE